MENEQVLLKLEVFEGPLELLMHLLKKNKVSIYDIPIEKITKQYLEYLDGYKEFNIEISSEFLIMAAELLLIKSKMLLPRHEEEEEDDPRKELVDKLLEHQRIKVMSEFLKDNEFATRYNFFKNPDVIEKAAPDYSDQTFDIDRLINAFMNVIDKNERKAPPPKASFSGIVGHEKISVTSRASYIKGMLKNKKRITFDRLFTGIASRPVIVATFLALLELMKLNSVFVDTESDEITVTLINDFDE